MVDWLLSSMFLAAFAPVIFYGWRMVKAMLFISDQELHSVAAANDPDLQLRLSQARLRRMRTLRYANEHEAWDKDFSALTGGCPHCAGRRRSATRHVPYL